MSNPKSLCFCRLRSAVLPSGSAAPPLAKVPRAWASPRQRGSVSDGRWRLPAWANAEISLCFLLFS